MRLSKYQGLGNDFLLADLRAGDPALGSGGRSVQDPAAVRALCDRHFGVGADGVLAMLPPVSPGAEAAMRVLNADGSEAEMCGNGLRCVARYLREDRTSAADDKLIIDTGAGPLTCAIHRAADRSIDGVSIDMGAPRLERRLIPMTGPPDEACVGAPLSVAGRDLTMTCVSMGNPHAISFVDESGPALLDLARRIGPAVEAHDWFPRKTNAEFAHLHAPDRIELVVWERGCGITLACGTGACATVVAATLRGLSPAGTDVSVQLPGGELLIRVAADLSGVVMRGPAVRVFDVDIDLAALA